MAEEDEAKLRELLQRVGAEERERDSPSRPRPKLFEDMYVPTHHDDPPPAQADPPPAAAAPAKVKKKKVVVMRRVRSPGVGGSMRPAKGRGGAKKGASAEARSMRISRKIRVATLKMLRGEQDLFAAVETGDVKQVKRLISRRKVNPNCRLNRDVYPVHVACEKGHLEIVQYLVEIAKADLTAKNNLGWTAVHFAAYNARLECLRYILEYVNSHSEVKLSVDEQNSYTGFAALHECCQNPSASVEAVRLLVELGGANIELKALDGSTAEDIAAQARNVEVLKYLVRRGEALKFARKVEEWNTLKAEYKRHIQQMSLELKECHEQQKKVSRPEVSQLINSLEEHKKRQLELVEENMKLKQLVEDNMDKNFAFGFERLKQTFQKVEQLQAEYARRETYQNKSAAEVLGPMLATWKPQLASLVSELDRKRVHLQSLEREFTKLKEDSLGYLDTVFYFDQRKIESEKMFHELSARHSRCREELTRRVKALELKDIQFRLELIAHGDSDDEGDSVHQITPGEEEVASSSAYARMRAREELAIRGLQDDVRDVFKEMWRLSDCHFPRMRFKQSMREMFLKELKVDPRLLECDEILPLLRGGTLVGEGGFSECGVGLFRKLDPEHCVMVRVMLLERFIQQRERYYSVLRLQNLCSVTRITRVFLSKNKLGTKEAEIETELVTTTLKDWLQSTEREFADPTQVKELFKQVVDTVMVLHRRNLALQVLEWETIQLLHLDEARVEIIDNLIADPTDDDKRKNVRSLGNMLYQVLVRRLKAGEPPDIAAMPSYLPDCDKSFLRKLISEGVVDGTLYDDFFLGKKTDMEVLSIQNVDETVSSLLLRRKQARLEWSMDYSIIQLLTRIDKIASLDDLVHHFIINGVKDSVAFEKFLAELFAQRCKLVQRINGLWLPTDLRSYPSLWHSLGKLVLKCMLQKMQLSQLGKLHPFCFYLLNHHHDPTLLTLDQLCDFGRLFDSGLVDSLVALFQIEDPAKLVLFSTDGGLVRTPDEVKDYVRQEIWALLLGRRGHRLRNILAFKRGFYSLLTTVREKNLVRCLTMREMMHLACKDEVETSIEATVRSMGMVDRSKRYLVETAKSEGKKQSILYYKILEFIKHRRRHPKKVEILASFLNKEDPNCDLIFGSFFHWDALLTNHFRQVVEDPPSVKEGLSFVKYLIQWHSRLFNRVTADALEKFRADPASPTFDFDMWVFWNLFLLTRLKTSARGNVKLFHTWIDQALLSPNPDLSNFVLSALARSPEHSLKVGAVNDKLAMMRSGLTLFHFEIPLKYHLGGVTKNPYHEVVSMIRRSEVVPGVHAKLRMLNDACGMIQEIYGAHYTKHVDPGKHTVMGADDIHPIFFYCIAKANVRDVYAHMLFLRHYGDYATGQLGYLNSMFEAGVEHIRELVWAEACAKAAELIERQKAREEVDELNL